MLDDEWADVFIGVDIGSLGDGQAEWSSNQQTELLPPADPPQVALGETIKSLRGVGNGE